MSLNDLQVFEHLGLVGGVCCRQVERNTQIAITCAQPSAFTFTILLKTRESHGVLGVDGVDGSGGHDGGTDVFVV